MTSPSTRHVSFLFRFCRVTPELTCSVLTCTSEEYDNFFLQQEASYRGSLWRRPAQLHSPEQRKATRSGLLISSYHLDNLLSATLEHAPHPLGRRHVAHRKGEDGVANAANAWLDNLIFPVRSFKSLSLYVCQLLSTQPSACNLQSYRDRSRQQPNFHFSK